MTKKLWECKIGEVDEELLPKGSDAPMRRAVRETYKKLTGKNDEFCFSGWGGKLTEGERACVENREPRPEACAISDTELLDWLEAQGAPGMNWIARKSVTGRGFRLHQSPSAHSDSYDLGGSVGNTPRAAILAAIKKGQTKEKSGA